ncbi:hypothetical protein ACFL21_00225 [Patescibacteria group bacterium]
MRLINLFLNMEEVIPTLFGCSELITMILETIESTVDKREGLEDGYIKSATYAKFEKSAAILLMDVANIKRYTVDENLWYEDFQLAEEYKNGAAKQDLIDHYFRGKLTDFFIRTFSLFEDALSRTLEAEGFEFQKNNFEEKIKILKDKNILPAKSDRRFCRFCMHVRNTIHSNGFFGIKDQKFSNILGEGPFEFKKSQPVDFFTPQRQINWSKELVNIFEKIAESCKKSAKLKDNAMRENLG